MNQAKLLILLIIVVSACSADPARQARIDRYITVACIVDGVVVPIAQPIVAAAVPGGPIIAGADAILVHPAVVAACAARHGKPAVVEEVGAQSPVVN
jgi:hypothetical protein